MNYLKVIRYQRLKLSTKCNYLKFKYSKDFYQRVKAHYPYIQDSKTNVQMGRLLFYEELREGDV